MEDDNKTIKVKDKVYTIPPDYDHIFRERILVITGVGRSGTSILGKVLGSLSPTYFLYEPALMSFVPFLAHCHPSEKELYSLLIKSLLFEDYFLQIVQGRRANLNPQDESFVGHYMPLSEVKKRWGISRRKEAIKYLQNERPLFVIKVPGLQPLYTVIQQLFPQPRFVHIIRNGNDVISSTKNRGWYTDLYLNQEMVDWAEKRPKEGGNVPWCLDEESKRYFPDWNQITRAASTWRNLNEQGMRFCQENPDSSFQLKYEDFIRSPQQVMERFQKEFALTPTSLTTQHLNQIKDHSSTPHPSLTEQIEDPEHDKFISLMKKLGYLK